MDREPVRETTGKADKLPLYMKLYFQEVYTEVARIVGYAGFRHDKLEEKMNDLVERFGKKKIQEVCSELITLQFNGKEKRSGRREDAEVRLKEDVRKLCWQLLGPPPEKKAEFEMNMASAPPNIQETAANEAPTPALPKLSPKRPRRKRAEPTPAPEQKPAKAFPDTPIMQQYREAKEKHPNMVLVFSNVAE